MTAEQYSVDPQDLFYQSIKAVFKSWAALQLAIENDFGGSDTKEAAEWFHNATHQYVIENPDLEDFELEEFFDDTMNKEFNTLLDDDSALITARNVLKYFKMYQSGNNLELMNLINNQELKNKLTHNSVVKVSNNEVDTTSDEETDEENGEEMQQVEEVEPKKNALTAEESEQIEKMEDGWTWVGRSGKHYTKKNNQTDSNENMEF